MEDRKEGEERGKGGKGEEETNEEFIREIKVNCSRLSILTKPIVTENIALGIEGSGVYRLPYSTLTRLAISLGINKELYVALLEANNFDRISDEVNLCLNQCKTGKPGEQPKFDLYIVKLEGITAVSIIQISH